MADSAELEHVPFQIGTAVLAHDGSVIKATGDLTTEEGRRNLETLYKIIIDTSKCIGHEPMRRIAISFALCNYIATISEKNVYIVKTETTNLQQG